ncbi:hypothetical protein OM427_12165 [Halomonas sp. 18H]|nr:hypothetical protein [Halomonas sp. 18H]MCW4150278.1 hypothetical protein [Halomonas sp. 18H]
MMRLLAKNKQHIAAMFLFVVLDELQNNTLKDYGALHGVWEKFYAITIKQRFEFPSL